ncbi:Ig-like domain-containing protein [Geobacter grbiciae]|uniref:Ig-like domain-containing protein n=1 Tax=Geobacter grbiciae TaxID=155042 RepID=UPI001C024D1D|nr:Ig-like domain-containing protein [Geobacter grbiciae]MBT1076902.1 Ig-like domain-containing protein [Geobacter grbiciae]
MKGFIKLFFAAIVLCALVVGCGSGGGGGGVTTIDLIRPEISQTLPANGDTNVGTTSPIIITFSEPMNQDSVKAAFSLATGSTTIPCTFSYNGTTATFTPPALNGNTPYTATIAATAKDMAGNSLGSDHAWTFTTGIGPDTTPPTVQSVAPTGSGVGINSTIAITFSEPMNTDSVKAAFSLTPTADPTKKISGTFSFIGDTAVFTPDTLLDYSTSYTVTIATTATDLVGNNMTALPPWNFTTRPPPAKDTEAPIMSPGSEFPLDGSTDVPRNTPISVSFNEPIAPFYYGSINGYPTKVDIDYTTNTVTMKPTTLLTANTTYTVSIRVTDLAGNSMATTSQWQFTTGATPTSLP